MGCNPSHLSGTDCSSVCSPRGYKSYQQICSHVGSSLSMGPQALPRTCSNVYFHQGQSLLWASTCCGVGSSPGCRWVSLPPLASMGCRGTACLTTVFTTGCRGISALAPATPPPPLCSLTLVSAELFLSCVLTLVF